MIDGITRERKIPFLSQKHSKLCKNMLSHAIPCSLNAKYKIGKKDINNINNDFGGRGKGGGIGEREKRLFLT